MKEDQTTTQSDISHFRLLWGYIKPDITLFRIIILFMLGTIFFSLIGPLILQLGLDILEEAFNNNEPIPQSVMWFAIGYAVMIFISWWFRAFQIISTSKLSSRTISRLREDVYRKVLENNLSFFNEQQVGEIVSKTANDSNELINFSDRMAYVITNFLILSGIIVIMLSFSVELTLYSLFLLPIVFLIVFLLRTTMREAAKKWRHRLGLVNARFNEIFAGIQISKSFGREEDNFQRFIELNEATFDASKKRGFYIFIVSPVTDFFRHLILMAILFGGATAVFNQRISITTVFFFTLLLDYFYSPVIQLSHNLQHFQNAFSNLDRMLSIVASQEHREQFKIGKSANVINGEINFDNLTFAYVKGIPVLQNINLVIHPGERIAVVGHTGAGKTSLVSLLLRFYEQREENDCSGQLLIDNLPVQSYELRSLRQVIALV
ncbi:MAG: ABC transporter ATP-binding protein, partial [Candidatus Hodarchaeales archaeon]